MRAYLIVPGKLDQNLYQFTSGHPILPSVGAVVTDVHGDKLVVKSIEWFLHHPVEPQVWVRAEPYSEPSSEYHDDQTMKKVYDALIRTGLTHAACLDAINTMQNEGILFREMS